MFPRQQAAAPPNIANSKKEDEGRSAPEPGVFKHRSDFRCGGSSLTMRRLGDEMTRLAKSNHPVLITGESGTGKTTEARTIHERSARTGRFMDINCAALPDSLVESELFGFEKGAFTGATARKKGLFEVADKGTLFLDEIGELKPELQAKLLKAIDDRKIRRLGGVNEVHCNVRLIAASSRNPQRMIRLGTFREDLYYRLAVFELNMPPLRERRQDINELVFSQLALEQNTSGRAEPLQIDDRALKELTLYSWPGNIRQLQNVLARLACYTLGNTIYVADVRAELSRFKNLDADTIILSDSCSTLFPGESFMEFSSRVRRALIEAVKSGTNGNMSRVAQRLRIDRSSLLRIAKRTRTDPSSRVSNSLRPLVLAPGMSSHEPPFS